MSHSATSELAHIRFTYGNTMKNLLMEFKSINNKINHFLKSQNYPHDGQQYSEE